MFQPKLRSFLAATALLSVLTSLPVRALGSRVRQPREGQGHPDAASRVADSPWDLLVRWLCKAGVTIDPEGMQSKPPQEGDAGMQTTSSGALLGTGGPA